MGGHRVRLGRQWVRQQVANSQDTSVWSLRCHSNSKPHMNTACIVTFIFIFYIMIGTRTLFISWLQGVVYELEFISKLGSYFAASKFKSHVVGWGVISWVLYQPCICTVSDLYQSYISLVTLLYQPCISLASFMQPPCISPLSVVYQPPNQSCIRLVSARTLFCISVVSDPLYKHCISPV